MEQLISFITLSFDLSLFSSLADLYATWFVSNGDSILIGIFAFIFFGLVVGGMSNNIGAVMLPPFLSIIFIIFSLVLLILGDEYNLKFYPSYDSYYLSGEELNILEGSTGDYNKSFKFNSVSNLEKIDITIHLDRPLEEYVTKREERGDYIEITSSKLKGDEKLYLHTVVREEKFSSISKTIGLKFIAGEDSGIKIGNSCLYNLQNEIFTVECKERQKKYLSYLSGNKDEMDELTYREIDYLDSKLLRSIIN